MVAALGVDGGVVAARRGQVTLRRQQAIKVDLALVGIDRPAAHRFVAGGKFGDERSGQTGSIPLVDKVEAQKLAEESLVGGKWCALNASNGDLLTAPLVQDGGKPLSGQVGWLGGY